MNSPVQELLNMSKTIAIIGAKDKPDSAVDRVGKYLIRAGYTVIPVHPVRQNVWGLTTYTRIQDIPVPIDIVNVFRASEFCEGHALECMELATKPRCFWMQLGISNTAARSLLEKNNIQVIEDACIMVVHQQNNLQAF